MNVSLEGNRTRTAEFAINLRETYWVGVDVGYSNDDYIKGNCGADRLNSLHWKVFRIGKDGKMEQEPLGRIRNTLSSMTLYSNQFRANSGKYELEMASIP